MTALPLFISGSGT